MRNAVHFRGILIIGLFVIANIVIGLVQYLPAQGDGRSLHWDRFDVTIDNINTTNNQFQVTEDYALSIERGPFSFGFRDIPEDRLESIENVAIYQDNTPLQRTCSGVAGTYCVTHEGGQTRIRYYFLRSVQSNQSLQIRIAYQVTGALRSYEDGDQLYWVAVPSDRTFPALASRVTVVMPSGVPAERIASYPDTWQSSQEGDRITWTAPGSLGENGSVEVRVQYPHDVSMNKPNWQMWFDIRRYYEDNLRSLGSLLLLVVSAILGGGGAIWVLIRYETRGRDPEAITVPEYLTTPPTDELPGTVGVLLDETADMPDIMGTLVDLARRGYLVIEQTSSTSLLGLAGKTDFEFHRTDKSTADLAEYERILYKGIFRSGKESVSLADLRNKFYTSIPAIKHQLYARVVEQGYFTRSPEKTRNYWLWGSIAALVLATALFWGIQELDLSWVSPFLVAPPVALGTVGAAGVLAANYMPAKTEKGAQAAALWRAFRHYLKNITRYTDVEAAAQHFDDYIGFAIVFGLDKELTKKLVPAMTAVPTWYYPTYVGGPWHGGYRRGHTHPVGGLGDGPAAGMDFGGSGGGLNAMSKSLTDGLNAMSSGMGSMLNDAARTMTSKPSSSGSGGWSGGGGGGGGGSGGGSAGFG